YGLATVASTFSHMGLSPLGAKRHWCATVLLCERVPRAVMRIIDSTAVERRRFRFAVLVDLTAKSWLIPESRSRACRRAIRKFCRLVALQAA
ncbi:MAG TPA: hypothetical protein VGM03_17500, partial [Phycisphaerae bacterium]